MSDRVVILGGGVAGLSAAHELVERGFEVDVYERQNIPGGKARSIRVIEHGAPDRRAISGPGIERGRAFAHRPWLPGEHGFRFFPGFYKHVIDTMSRIPFGDGDNVAGNLVETTRVALTQYDRPEISVPTRFPMNPADIALAVRDALALIGPVIDVPPSEQLFFAARIWQIMTSCSERRMGEYEKIPWWAFIGADERSAAYQKILGNGITRSLVAAKAKTASTRTIGDIFVQLVLNMANPAPGSATDRVLNGPTNVVWIHPWMQYLESRGVRYHRNAEVLAVHCANGRIVGATVREDDVRREVNAEWYVCAMPVERFAPLVNAELSRAAPALGLLPQLARNVEWMNGIQYYLLRDVPIVHGHGLHLDTPWALTTISQRQFWPNYDPARYGDGLVHGILSVDISDWDAPNEDGRCASECTREEVALEVWKQLKRSLNTDGRVLLRDEDLHYWFLDPDIQPSSASYSRLTNHEPLLVNQVDTWRLRPDAVTAIPNFFLASDYVRTYTDLATMEAANEAARRAVNGILAASGSAATPCQLWKLHEPAVLAPWRAMDEARYRQGLPWDATLERLAMPIGMPLDALWKALPSAAFSNVGVRAMRDASSSLPGSAASGDVPESAGPPGDDIDGRLAFYNAPLAKVLRGAVPSNEPSRHLYGLIGEFLGRGGKGLRPGLLLATFGALGGRGDTAVPAAAAIEMLHNAFLVHDDIEDGSELRRGLPTLHTTAGVPLAINAGDAMTALSMRLLRGYDGKLPPATVWALLGEFDHMLGETLEGQAVELGWIRDNTVVTESDYLSMVLQKTSWYSFIHPMRMGALLARGGAGGAELDRFNRFGELLGGSFQITDDVLNLVGTRSRYGKEIGGDLLEGKRTLALVHLLASASPRDRAKVLDFLGRPRDRKLPREVHAIYGLLDRHGSVGYAQSVATRLLDEARAAFETAFAGVPASADRTFLHGLMNYLGRREV